MKQKTLLLITLMICSTTLLSQIIYVPADQPTIQAGIEAANNGDTVIVAEGTYYENIRFLGKAITVASQYLINQDESHIINTIINGSQAQHPDTASCVMFIDGEDTTSVICGFTITGGTGFLDPGWNVKHGGGIVVEQSGAKIENNIISQNYVEHDWAAGGSGIGAVCYQGNTWLVARYNTIKNNQSVCTGLSAFGGGISSTINSIIQYNIIEYNTCENQEGTQADGGGIEIEELPGSNPIEVEISCNTIQYNTLSAPEVSVGAGVIIVKASAHIHNNIISHNVISSTMNGVGAGLYTHMNLVEIIIEHNEFNHNEITSSDWARGGAIALWEPLEDIKILHNTLEGNTVDGLNNRGPGVWIRYPMGNMTLVGNLFKGNIGPQENIESGAGGGLVIMDAGGEVLIDKNLFIENEMYNGGGLYLRRSLNSVVSNNVFYGNKAVHGGAFSYYHPSDDNPTLTTDVPWPVFVNNTVINNEATNSGGGVRMLSQVISPVIFNCILRDNAANAGPAVYSQYWNPFLVDHCNIPADDIYGNWVGDDNINEEITFLDDSCHLAQGCICVEAGILEVEFNGIVYSCPHHDIDGELRPMNGTADIGVDEVLLTNLSKFQTRDIHRLTNYPNPFTNQTTIEFYLPDPENITLTITDINGKKVESILSEYHNAGIHQINWKTNDLNEGVYFLNLKTNTSISSKKLILMNNE